MFTTVAIPVWLLVLVGILATIAALERIIGPSLRWMFRGRVERLVAQLNTRLDRPIEPFRLMARKDMVVRLTYDPKVMEAVVDYAAETGMPGEVVLEEAQTYAREIVPGFSAWFYFGFGARAAKWLSRLLFRVRIGKVDAALERIDRQATVIFVMNHRSNMDYVLVTWLVSGRSALSYAVGEWARIWPLSMLIRSMGAYFIRRRSRNTLYRRVLARYVQLVTAEGATQAVFPEGGLSLDGRVGAAKMGLLNYIVTGFDPTGRDVVFVPVALAYDRVLEDRVLVNAAQAGERRFRARPMAIIGAVARMMWQKFRRKFKGFGTAAVAFGAPLSLRDYLAEPGATTEALGGRLMAAVVQSVPVLSVPLVAAVIQRGAGDRAAILSQATVMVAQLTAMGAILKLPPAGVQAAVDEALTALILRGILADDAGVLAGQEPLIAFYAASVLQRLEAGAPQSGGAMPAV